MNRIHILPHLSIKTLIIIVATIQWSAIIFAQLTPNELDRIYTPAQNSPFSKEAGKTGKGGSNDIKNAILFEPFWVARGLVGGTYHRQLWRDGLIATVGIGIPYSEDKIFTEIFDVDAAKSMSQYSQPVSPGRLLSGSEYIKGKPMLQFAVSYFFDEDGLEGQGVEFGYRLQRYQMDFVSGASDGLISGSSKHDIAIRSFFCNYKIQWVGRGKRPMVNAVSYGLGLKHMEYTVFDEGDGQFGFSGPITNTGTKARSEYFPTVMLSYSLGFGF